MSFGINVYIILLENLKNDEKLRYSCDAIEELIKRLENTNDSYLVSDYLQWQRTSKSNKVFLECSLKIYKRYKLENLNYIEVIKDKCIIFFPTRYKLS